jgi:formylglycine-generating enzyme required for sulfatase activity
MKKLLFITAIIFACMSTKANNIQITNVSVVSANNTIKFDISWDNGWRSGTLNNWDAAWVFFKYKDISGNWQHIYLTNTGNTIPSGFSSTIANNPSGVGAFLYRSASGNGTTTLTNVELGINAAQATGIFDIKAFAIEMVYIPQAAYYLGDAFSPGAFPFTNIVNNNISFIEPFGSLAISSNFPNGYAAFYCMKYELSQGGYRDFLNTLTYTQQVAHILPSPSAASGTGALVALAGLKRNNVIIKTSGVASTTAAVFGCDANFNGIYDEAADGEWIACNYLSWVDQAAYLYWAGLRPLTEMEFEKTARGILLPVAGEYVWGNNTLSTNTYIRTSQNMASEMVSNPSSSPTGNAASDVTHIAGPLRNGIFATATSDRITSGGSFYGVMELSGNLVERVVSTRVGVPYKGDHGTGTLSFNGFAGNGSNNIFWPNINTTTFYIDGTVSNFELMDKGGAVGGNIFSGNELRTSARFNVGSIISREFYTGIRGCRTAF